MTKAEMAKMMMKNTIEGKCVTCNQKVAKDIVSEKSSKKKGDQNIL
jgi:hypothetical protein